MKNSVHVSDKKQDLNPSPVTSKSETVFLHVNSFCDRVATKERCKSQLLLQSYRNKACERCFGAVGHLSSKNTVTNVPTVAINPPVGSRLRQFWEK